MNITFLIGQRKVRYPGEYAPEVLEVISDGVDEENPGYRHEAETKYWKTAEFDRLAWITTPLDAERAEPLLRRDGPGECYATPLAKGKYVVRTLLGRRHSDAGAQGIEVIDAMDEFGIDDNSDYLPQKASQATTSGAFATLGYVDLGFDMQAVMLRLYPEREPLASILLTEEAEE